MMVLTVVVKMLQVQLAFPRGRMRVCRMNPMGHH